MSIQKQGCAFLALFLFFMTAQFTYAQNDYSTHWAKEGIETLMSLDIISGYADGSIKPDNGITRAELVTLINKAFSFHEKVEENFSDVFSGDWYYQEFSKAKAAGYLLGDNHGNANPNLLITRGETCVILARIFKLDSDYQNNFIDAGSIPQWALREINALYKAGYVSGYPDNSFRANDSITRGESFYLILKLMGFREKSEEPTKNAAPLANMGGSVSSGRGGSSGGGGISRSTKLADPVLTGYDEKNHILYLNTYSTVSSYRIRLVSNALNTTKVYELNKNSGFLKISSEKCNIQISSFLEEFYRLSKDPVLDISIYLQFIGTGSVESSNEKEVKTMTLTLPKIDTPKILYYKYSDEVQFKWNEVEHAGEYQVRLIIGGVDKSDLLTVDIVNRKASITKLDEIEDQDAFFIITAISNDPINFKNALPAQVDLKNDEAINEGPAPANLRLSGYEFQADQYLIEWDELKDALEYNVKIKQKETILYSGVVEEPHFELTIGEEFDGLGQYTILVSAKFAEDLRGKEAAVSVDARFAGGTGTTDDPYLIATARQFNNIVLESDKNYLQIEDITTPIKTPISIFKGVYKGDGASPKTISVNIDTKTGKTGLFAEVSGTVSIENLKLVGEVTGDGQYTSASNVQYSAVGGFVGMLEGSTVLTISKCINEAMITQNVSSSSYSGLGGIVGVNRANVTIDSCINRGELSQNVTTYTGGILGTSFNGSVVNCKNYGTVNGRSNTGGIIGYCYLATVYRCANFGEIKASGRDNIGGIAGAVYGSNSLLIEECYNKGSVTGRNYVAGIAGNTASTSDGRSISIKNCFNTGVITATIPAGLVGIHGHTSRGGPLFLENCYDNQTSAMNPIGSVRTHATYTYVVTAKNVFYLWDGASSNTGFYGEGILAKDLTKLLENNTDFSKSVWDVIGEYPYPQLKYNSYEE